MKLSIVLSTQQAKFEAVAFKGGLQSNIAKISGWGYDGVELAIREPERVDPEGLANMLAQYDLFMPAIGTGQAWGEEGLSFPDPDPAIRQAAIDRVKSHVPLAARFDAVIIIGLLRGIVKEGVSQEQAMRWVVEALAECSKDAERSGVRLALEPINRYETTLINTVVQGMDLIQRIGSPSFGLLLDTFHMNIEEPVLEESIRLAGDRIFHFHVADSNRWYPGAGHLDFISILEALFDTGFQGYVSGEFMPEPEADYAAEQAIQFLQKLEL